MKTRVISAIVALAIFIPLIIIGDVYFAISMGILSVLAYKEILDLKKSHGDIPNIIKLLGLISLIYFATYTKRTKEGNEEYLKWIGLKNFMNDSGKMDVKELPEVRLWEKYLVYAVSLGCASKLAKTMKIHNAVIVYKTRNSRYQRFSIKVLFEAINI